MSFAGFSQTIIGSGNKNKGEEIEAERLDLATVRVYYHFTQKKKASDKEVFRNDTLTLDIGPEMSRYYDEAKLIRDSIFSSVFSNINPDHIQSVTVLKGSEADRFDSFMGDKYENDYYDGTTEQIYKNRGNGEFTIIDRARESYKCSDPVSTFDWNITTDTLTVLGYNCQKANTHFRGRDYEVWFTSEIPINDGPWKFFGLPGLILRVNDTKGLLAFESVGLQYLDNPYAIEIPKGRYIVCNRKELEKARNMRGGGMGIGINGGNVLIVGRDKDPSFKSIELE